MLVGFYQGASYDLAIGSEQGIPKWDDFVIEHNDGTLEHIQVKRQTTNFSDDPVKRDKVNAGKTNERNRDLTSFDESIKALADWTRKNDPEKSTVKRIFRVVVPTK